MILNQTLIDALNKENFEPRVVIEISFGENDSYYFTSHADVALPAGVTTNVLHGSVKDVSTRSEKIDPLNAKTTVAPSKFTLLDIDAYITNLIGTKKDQDRGVNHNLVKIYWFERGSSWSENTLLQTAILDKSYNFNKGEYQFNTADIKRITQKKIWPKKLTTLAGNISATDLLIPVNAPDGFFEPVLHDQSYTDRPNQSIFYIRLKRGNQEEVVACTGMQDQNCIVAQNGRGALNTLATAHTIRAEGQSEQQVQVTQCYHVEGPAPKLLYKILTGLNTDGSPAWPSDYHLNLSTTRASDFENIGQDLWDTVTDKGKHLSFTGLEDQDGLKLCESQILRWIRCVFKIYNTGELGLKRRAPVLRDAAYSLKLDDQNIVKYSLLSVLTERLSNNLEVRWAKDLFSDDYNKSTALFSPLSSLRYNELTDKRIIEFDGVHTGSDTDESMRDFLNSYLDESAEPPLSTSIEPLPIAQTVAAEVGDIVLVNTSNIRDPLSPSDINRSFEIIEKSFAPLDGDLRFKLRGSQNRGDIQQQVNFNSVLNEEAYTNNGTDLNTVLAIGNGNVQTSDTLSGNASNANHAKYFFLGDLTIPSGVPVNWTQNIQLFVRGHLQINDGLIGKGQGRTGRDHDTAKAEAAANTGPGLIYYVGEAGFVGTTTPSGKILARDDSGVYERQVQGFNAGNNILTVVGQHQSIPYFNLKNNDGNLLEGLPRDMRGSSGSASDGGTLQMFESGDSRRIMDGSNGGDSGGSITIICQSIGFGAGGYIDTSGGDGEQGNAETYETSQFIGAAGAGGSPSGVLICIDGNSPTTDLTGHINAFQGRQLPANIDNPGNLIEVLYPGAASMYSASEQASFICADYGSNYINHDQSMARVQYIPAPSNPIEEISPPPSDVIGFNAIQLGDNVNFSWTPPDDISITGTTIKYGEVGVSWGDANILLDEYKGTAHTAGYVPPGSYDFLARHKNTNGQLSTSIARITLDVVNGNFDLISEVNHQPDWTGCALTNFGIHHTGVLYPKSEDGSITMEQAAQLYGWAAFDSWPMIPATEYSIETPEQDGIVDAPSRIYANVEFCKVPGTSGSPYIATEADYRKSSEAFDGFESWTIGEKVARYAKFRFMLQNSFNAFIKSIRTAIDAKEVYENRYNINVPVGGIAFTFNKVYRQPPFLYPQLIGATELFIDQSVLNLTSTDCYLLLRNKSGDDVGGNINLKITGN